MFGDLNKGQSTMILDLIATENHWVLISKQELSFHIKKNTQPHIKWMQFPRVLAWACTTHKVKVLSMHCGAMSFSLQWLKSFNQGQTHVALHRIRSLETCIRLEYAPQMELTMLLTLWVISTYEKIIFCIGQKIRYYEMRMFIQQRHHSSLNFYVSLAAVEVRSAAQPCVPWSMPIL